MSGVDQLAKAAWVEQGQEVHEFNGATVTNVNPDGTVNLNYLGEDHLNISAMSNYLDRQTGDFVVVRSNGDHWIVIGKVGIAWEPTFPTTPPTHQHPYTDIQSPPPTVTWGLTDPSPMTGWNVVITGVIWAHNDGRIYMKAGTGTPPPGTPPPDPPITPPVGQVYTINQTDDRLFLNFSEPWNGQLPSLDLQTWNTGQRAQGTEFHDLGYYNYSEGPFCTAWYYGSALRDAANANPSKMEFLIKRDTVDDGSGGALHKPIFYLHSASAAVGSTISLNDGPWQGPSLAYGQSAWWTLPSAMVNQLKTAGGQRGIAVWSNKISGCLRFNAAGSGQVKVTP